MSRLQPTDLSVWPRYLTEGRKSQEQVLIAYLWSYALEGREWTLSELTQRCGCTVNRKALDSLVEEGLLLRTEESERKNSKPCHEYVVNAGFVPEHKAPAKKGKAAKPVYPQWVFIAVTIWKEKRGIVGPRDVLVKLSPAVKEHGAQAVLDGLRKYARVGEKWGDTTLHRFTLNLNKWIEKPGPEARGRSLADIDF